MGGSSLADYFRPETVFYIYNIYKSEQICVFKYTRFLYNLDVTWPLLNLVRTKNKNIKYCTQCTVIQKKLKSAGEHGPGQQQIIFKLKDILMDVEKY